MGAGISKQQQRRIKYRQLQKIKRELEQAGVAVNYWQYQLFSVGRPVEGFNISFNRMNASNGEACLYPVVTIANAGGGFDGKWRGWWDANTYEKGIEHVKRIFGKQYKVPS